MSAAEPAPARRRRAPAAARWCLGAGAALLLTVGVFVVGEQRQYAAGHAYGEREAVVGAHVFDGEHPGGDVSAYAGPAGQECVEHGASDGASGSPAWVRGCVDAVLRR